jgi:hypothetical protein
LFGATEPDDASCPTLDLSFKPYRQRIMNNEITEFDFLSFLFGCKVLLLFKMGSMVLLILTRKK